MLCIGWYENIKYIFLVTEDSYVDFPSSNLYDTRTDDRQKSVLVSKTAQNHRIRIVLTLSSFVEKILSLFQELSVDETRVVKNPFLDESWP